MKHAILAACSAILLTFCVAAPAAEPKEYREVYDEIYTTDGQRDLVLTMQPCPLPENHGYVSYGYIIGRNGVEAEACWQESQNGKQEFDVWIPAEKKFYEIPKNVFAPRGDPRIEEVPPKATL